jgi:hypothetical protein
MAWLQVLHRVANSRERKDNPAIFMNNGFQEQLFSN